MFIHFLIKRTKNQWKNLTFSWLNFFSSFLHFWHNTYLFIFQYISLWILILFRVFTFTLFLFLSWYLWDFKLLLLPGRWSSAWRGSELTFSSGNESSVFGRARSADRQDLKPRKQIFVRIQILRKSRLP